ncbi:LysR family transcriptional regulator [Vibrio palustris]|uniref:Nodulation protein D 2 n=1 Tax=Vibrio palustris TaxID=1918946 RepID=A0A1R4B134_9VIBR|nr:LysR family transcriptional regulator [Vibrio palustris]SJL82619.1 Nodulation protein D 2 [Vibrio palustris]
MNGMQKLDIKQLRILNALLAEKNLSRVADNMGLTQQAISEQLRKLRDVFADRLLVRQGNSMVPTPLALELGTKIHTILSDIESLSQVNEFSPATYKGVITISATDYAIEAVLPSFLRVVREQAPHLKLIVTDFESDQLSAKLTSGELDLALTFPPFVSNDIPWAHLFDEQHICVASACSELCNQAPLSLEQLASLPQLVISPSKANLKGSHDRWFAEQGLERNIVMSLPSFKGAPDVLYTTDMVAFYPSRLLPNSKVASIAMDVQPPKFEVIVAWHPRTQHSQIHQWLLGKLQEICGKSLINRAY